jgi:hypothetical protein
LFLISHQFFDEFCKDALWASVWFEFGTLAAIKAHTVDPRGAEFQNKMRQITIDAHTRFLLCTWTPRSLLFSRQLRHLQMIAITLFRATRRQKNEVTQSIRKHSKNVTIFFQVEYHDEEEEDGDSEEDGHKEEDVKEDVDQDE